MMHDVGRLLRASILVALLASCVGAGQGSPSPIASGTAVTKPTATAAPNSTSTEHPSSTEGAAETVVAATVVAASSGIGSTGHGETNEPGTSPGPTPEATPIASVPALDHPNLRYRLIDQLGKPMFCDPDFYPIPRADELVLARQSIAAIRKDAPTYTAILAHLGIAASANPTPDQMLAIYRDWKTLRAVVLTPVDGRFSFDFIAAAPTNDQTGSHVVGTIDSNNTISITQREPSGPPPCPICLARGTLIATPEGDRPVEDLRPGMDVWTTDPSGRRVAGTIVEVGSTPVPATHEVVHLVLSDGRTVDVSPGHRLPDGRRLGDLRPGNLVDGAAVTSAALRPYDGGATFDLLPSGPTATYWANGILLASTLR
jgi:hypothetical protein